jgi:cyclopropane fatty-acyl-phospholipid synthase-like methyltransferase
MRSILALFILVVAATGRLGSAAADDGTAVAEYYDRAAHYDVLWGRDNIHSGWYPHLENRAEVPLNFSQAAMASTRRLLALGDVAHDSAVLDLGCGKGLACKVRRARALVRLAPAFRPALA